MKQIASTSHRRPRRVSGRCGRVCTSSSARGWNYVSRATWDFSEADNGTPPERQRGCSSSDRRTSGLRRYVGWIPAPTWKLTKPLRLIRQPPRETGSGRSTFHRFLSRISGVSDVRIDVHPLACQNPRTLPCVSDISYRVSAEEGSEKCS